MATNLRAGFKKRQRKCLSESMTVISPPTKKPCTKIHCLELVSAIAPTLEPSVTTAGISPASDGRPSSVGRVIHPELRGPPMVQRNSMMTLFSVLLLSLHVLKHLMLLAGRK